MAAQQQWQPNNDGGPMTMAARQGWPNNNGSPMTMAQQQWSIARENASIAGGTPQGHKAIATRAREGAGVTRGRHESTRQYSIASKPVRMQAFPEKRHKITWRYSIARQKWKGRARAQIALRQRCSKGKRSRRSFKWLVVEHHLRQILMEKWESSLKTTTKPF